MDIHNLMEEAVLGAVDELFANEERKPSLGFCTCGQCRLDVACYVLNRVKPEYIISSRGLAYAERDFLDKVQKRADIISLAREGWSRVDHRPRHTTRHEESRLKLELPEGPAFNFPTVMGRAFNGLNFEPLAGGGATLFVDGIAAPMVDPNWQNPFAFAQATAGTYIFWARPVAAGAAGAERRFSLEVRIEVQGFDPVAHFFELELTADRQAREEFSLQSVHKIPDLYLFPT